MTAIMNITTTTAAISTNNMRSDHATCNVGARVSFERR
jgi:hypothetical protein